MPEWFARSNAHACKGKSKGIHVLYSEYLGYRLPYECEILHHRSSVWMDATPFKVPVDQEKWRGRPTCKITCRATSHISSWTLILIIEIQIIRHNIMIACLYSGYAEQHILSVADPGFGMVSIRSCACSLDYVPIHFKVIWMWSYLPHS